MEGCQGELSSFVTFSIVNVMAGLNWVTTEFRTGIKVVGILSCET